MRSGIVSPRAFANTQKLARPVPWWSDQERKPTDLNYRMDYARWSGRAAGSNETAM